MSFAQPAWLWGLSLLPLLALGGWLAWRQRLAALATLMAPSVAARLQVGADAGAELWRAGLHGLAFAASLVALAQPRWGSTWEPLNQAGSDIVVAVDVSDSMLVQDTPSAGQLSRLAQAKRAIIDLLRLLHGDRVGLVAFAGSAFIECPLTLDYNAVAMFLDDLDTDLIGVKGTALGGGIRTALAAMQGAEHSAQAIILMTDGEEQDADALNAADSAQARQVRIFPIGIGHPEGAPIPNADGSLRRDAHAQVILSKLNEPILRQIAQRTGGLYTHSLSGAVDMEALYRQGIQRLLQSRTQVGAAQKHHTERFQLFLGIAWLAWATEAWWAARARQAGSLTPNIWSRWRAPGNAVPRRFS